MEHITILTEAKFLINDLFGDITCEEVEKHRVRIDNLQNIITYLLHNNKAVSKTDKSLTSFQNLKQFDDD